ncbi:hypothetical protein V501_00253 [Pseudogymnoascus sp. VKM F-4519 (FW-2642)]|nr:hypothetical protein V501_00253 [Pseudogymnoascus sp. VKM F-4519 (FW-2642)]
MDGRGRDDLREGISTFDLQDVVAQGTLAANCACHSRKGLQMCAARRKGARDVDAQRARCHREELGGMEGAIIEKRESSMWLCECVHVPLRVFSCGEAEQGDPLGGAMQCKGGGAERAKRGTMSAAGARMLGGRSDGVEGQSRREEGVALL